MNTVTVNASVKYDCVIGSGVVSELGARLRQLGGANKVLLVSDSRVAKKYADRATRVLTAAGFNVSRFFFPDGERSKTLYTYGELLEAAQFFGLTKSDLFVALGGGVTGDLTGFAAATYKRGTRFVQLPTTLLAAVDASVGGKTAVNLRAGKNQVGAFHQPSLVLCDTDFLKSLPARQYRSGLAEVIKYAMIADGELFDRLRAHVAAADAAGGEAADVAGSGTAKGGAAESGVEFRFDAETAADVIATCVDIKRRFVEQDEFDRGARMLLNFGHTVGHAIEAAGDFNILHGYAVAAGMALITRAACNRGFCADEVPALLEALLAGYKLPADTKYDAETLLPFITGDKKREGNVLKLIVPETIGRCRIVETGADEMAEWLYDGGVR